MNTVTNIPSGVTHVAGFCPICGAKLDENNRVHADYYAPKDWFVLKHDKLVNGEWKNWCGQANYQLTFNP